MTIRSVLFLAAALLAGCAGQQAADIPPPTPAQLLEQARAAQQDGQLDAALALYARAAETEETRVDGLTGRGEVLVAQGNAIAARHEFTSALAHAPGHWQALQGMGMVEDLVGHHAVARDWYEQALQRAPSAATIYNNYGYSRIMARDYAGAERLLNAGLARAPGHGRLTANLALAIAWQGDYERALRTAATTATLAQANNDVGYIAYLRGDRDAAIRMFRAAIDASPTWFARAAANLERAQRMPEAAPTGQ